MAEIHPVMLTVIIKSLIIFFAAIVCFPLWYVHHKLLSRRLDPILFKAPYFNRAELINYQHFPLYLVKAINYVYLVAWPTMAKRRRFKGLDRPLPIGRALRATCIIQIALMAIGAITGIFWFAFMVVVLY